jgi:hypothetical protein
MDECCAPPPLNVDGSEKQDDGYRRVLWAVLALQGAAIVICQSLGELRPKRGPVIGGLTSWRQ